MKMNLIKLMIAGVFVLISTAWGVAADIPMGDEASMTEEQKAMMGRMKEYTTPNENHEILKSLEGAWSADVKFWMDPKGQPQESQGTSEAKMMRKPIVGIKP